MEVISRLYNWHACPSEVQYLIVLQLRKTRSRLPSKMVQLASLFFLLFCTVSPKLLLLNNNSSMDMKANPNNISPMVLFKSTTLPTKTSSFSTKPNSLRIKSELPIFIEPLPVFSGIGSASVSLMDLEVNPTMVLILVTIVLLLGLILLLVLIFRTVLPKELAGCVNNCCLPIQCNSYYAKRSAYQEI